MIDTLEASRGREVQEKPFNVDSLINSLTYVEETSSAPVANNRSKLRDALRLNNTLVFRGDPGSGKSTIGPLSILNELLIDNRNARIGITQPTRLATESVAQFVTQELGEDGDHAVDYRFKGHGFSKPNSRIEFSVGESTLKEIASDEMLSRYDAIFVDEAHLRTITIDLLLPLLKRAQELRSDTDKPLKIVIASATLDAQVITDYFPDAGTVHVEGVSHHVDEYFSEAHIEPNEVMGKAADKAIELLGDKSKSGDLLIFMPGRAEITATEEIIRAKLSDPDIEIVTLMGGDQDGDPYKKIYSNTGKRKVYISTNVAETSITIPEITMVIDSGLMKTNVYDPNTRLTTLETAEHTRGNWIQRSRRAGRTQPGEAHALYTKDELAKRSEHQVAEFLRSDLTPQILKLKAAGINDVINFPFIEHPGNEVIGQGLISLTQLGALDEHGNLTQLGQAMAEMDQDPHIARILLESAGRDCVDAVAVLVGAMQMKESPYLFDFNSEKFNEKYKDYIDPDSDFITLLNVWNDFIKDPKNDAKWREKGLNPIVLSKIARESRNMKRELGLPSGKGLGEPVDIISQREAIDLSIASGLIPYLLVGENGKYRYQTGAASGIQIDKSSVFYSTYSDKLLTGKIFSQKRDRKKTLSKMNMKFDQGKLLANFEYLNNFFQPKIENAIVKSEVYNEKSAEQGGVDKKAQADQAKREDVEFGQKMNVLEKDLVNNDKPKEVVRKDTETFIQKIRANWNKLTDRIKQQFINFKEAIKKIFK